MTLGSLQWFIKTLNLNQEERRGEERRRGVGRGQDTTEKDWTGEAQNKIENRKKEEEIVQIN